MTLLDIFMAIPIVVFVLSLLIGFWSAIKSDWRNSLIAVVALALCVWLALAFVYFAEVRQ